MVGKNAFLENARDEVVNFFKSPRNTHEKIIPTLDRVFSHNTTAGLLGGALGAGGGLLRAANTPKDSKGNRPWLRNAAIGGGIGVGGGLLGSVAFPEASKRINEELVKKFIRQPVGRVMTNIVEPRGYEHLSDASFKQRGYTTPEGSIDRKRIFKDVVKSTVNDTPAPWIDRQKPGPATAEIDDVQRSAIYRKSFDLPIRPVDQHSLDYYVPEDSPAARPLDNYSPNLPLGKSNNWTINPNTLEGRTQLQNIFQAHTKLRNRLADAADFDSLKSPLEAHQSDGVMGNFLINTKPVINQQNKLEDVQLSVKDPWDFDLHPNEGFDNPSKFARYFINRIINPQTVTLNQSAKQLFPDQFN